MSTSFPTQNLSSPLGYWREVLAGLPEEIDVPGLRSAAPDQGASAPAELTATEFRLGESVRASLELLARECGGDAVTTLRAGVALLLVKLGAGADLPLGAVLGDGDTVSVLRITVRDGVSFRGLMAEVRAAELATAQHGPASYKEIADAVNSARKTPGRCLFRIGVAAGEHGAHQALVRTERSSAWFALEAAPTGEPGLGLLLHSPDVLDAETARGWCERLVRLATAAVRDPDSPVEALAPLLPGEERALLALGAGPEQAPAAPSIVEWFERGARQWPDEVAITCGSVSLSYAELDARADQLSWVLVARGGGPERVVGVALPRSAGWVVAFLAILKAGAIYLPLDVGLPAERMAMMLADAHPAVALTGGAGLQGWDGELVIVAPDGGCTESGSGGAADGAERVLPERIWRDQPIYLLYTSGSTGRPKGVLMTNKAIVNLLTWHLGELATAPGRITAQFTSPSFDISVQELLATLLSGATLALPPEDVRRSPFELAAWLAENHVTDLYAPNVVVELVCRGALDQELTLPDLGDVAQAGEALAPGAAMREVFRSRPGRRLHNHYGPTETHAITACTLPAEVSTWPEPVPIGRPVGNTRIYVLDDALRLVPEGVAGELFAAGDCLARGYHNRPGLTAERFLPDPFGPPGARMYRTGDVARWRADGMLDYLGRADQQVKIRGMRVELGEIESLVRKTPNVQDAVAKAAGADGHRRLDAYLVIMPGADPAATVAAALDLLRAALPAALVPSTFTVLDALPLNSNKKVDRKALPAPVLAEPDQYPTPRTEQETALAELYAQVLGYPAVGIHDDFYQRGGNSLLAAELTVRIRKAFDVEITIGDVLGSTSVARLAELLRLAEPARPAVRAGAGGARRPASFAQQSMWIVDQIEGPSPRYNEPLALRFRGSLDTIALRQAFHDVVARHDSLRTVLTMSDDEIWQQVQPAGSAVAEWEERLVDPAVLDMTLTETARRPFDLAADLPVRGLLGRTGADDHVLLLTIHHMACDGASMELLAGDLATAYRARSKEEAPVWPPIATTYGDYAAWQRELFAAVEPSGLAKRQAEYWTRQLAGLSPAMPLPGGRSRPELRDGAGARVRIDIPAAAHAEVTALARRSGSTSFMVVHAALAALLTEQGCGTDIVIGAAVSARTETDLEKLVGHFVNTVALRVNTSGAPSFDELLGRVRTTDLAALAHRELPFEQVVELVNPERSLSFQPVVQVMLAFQVAEAEPFEAPGLDVRYQPVELGVAKFDLCFKLTEHFTADGSPAGIVGSLEYAVDVFSQRAAQEIVANLTDRLGSHALSKAS